MKYFKNLFYTILISEKWLPYKTVDRQVIHHKIKTVQSAPPPKNIIIQYEKPTAVSVKQVFEEGVFRVDPATYQSSTNSTSEIRYVDKITDLPIETPRFLSEVKVDQKSNKANNENSSGVLDLLLNSSSNIIKKSNPNETARVFSQTSIHQKNTFNDENESINKSLYSLSSSCVPINRNTSKKSIYSFYLDSYQNINKNVETSFFQTPNNLNKHAKKYVENIDYEVIKSSVSEDIALKIIAEAIASGKIIKSVANLN